MPVLVGLPGMKGEIPCRMVWNRFGAKRVLKQGMAATAAGNKGAINIWIDNDGCYQCEAYYLGSTHASATFRTWKDVSKWLKQWFHEIA